MVKIMEIKKLYETKTFYVYCEMVNGTERYFVGINGQKGYMGVYYNETAAIRECNYFEKELGA